MDIRTEFKVKIHSVGTYLPSDIVTSDSLFEEFNSERRFGIATDWMTNQMGIIERRMAPDGTLPSELAIPAAQQAIDNCENISLDEIDLVLFCGIKGDQLEPSTAHGIQKSLGLTAKNAFNVSDACFGFMDGIQVGANYIKAGDARYVLIVTGEIPSEIVRGILKVLKRKDMTAEEAKKKIGLLSLGDAGGAVVLGPSYGYEASGFQGFNNVSLSRHYHKCHYNIDANGQIDGHMRMAGLSVAMVKEHSKLIKKTLNDAGWVKLDWLLSHQIGKQPFDSLAKSIGVDKSKAIQTFRKLGNITSATFPISYAKLLNSAKVKVGERIGCLYAGSGATVGQATFTA